MLRLRGVPATTIHRILYTPIYDPQYEKIAEWLTGAAQRPVVEGLTDVALMVALLTWELIRNGWRSVTGKTLVGDTDEDRAEDLR